MSKIDSAVAWAVSIANDDSHGYDQTDRWSPDYDCASLVISAWEQAGVLVKTNGASYTGNMVDVFLSCGFKDVTSSINLSTGAGLKKGDVCWRRSGSSGHTEMMISETHIVGATSNEHGTATGGTDGDQTGEEIRVRAYYNYPWMKVLRYNDIDSPPTNISDNGMNFLKNEEGCKLTAYKLEGETYWTIGYGHYGADVYEGMTITQEQAEAYFREDLKEYEQYVIDIAMSKFPGINQNQFDALVSYCYNRGPGKSDGSNGLRQLIYNSDTLSEVSANFPVYWGSNTEYKDSLIARRNRERALFDTPFNGDSGGSGSSEGNTVSKTKHKPLSFLLMYAAIKNR